MDFSSLRGLASQPVGCEPFHRGRLRLETTDIYGINIWKPQIFTWWLIAVARLQLWNSNGNDFMVGVTITWGAVFRVAALGRFWTTEQLQSSVSIWVTMQSVLDYQSHRVIFEFGWDRWPWMCSGLKYRRGDCSFVLFLMRIWIG